VKKLGIAPHRKHLPLLNYNSKLIPPGVEESLMRVGSFTSLIPFRRACLLLGISITAITPIKAERLPIKIYTTADGLANNVVNKIVTDSRGFRSQALGRDSGGTP
jgi:hypothetical protein